jgi:hypothetical protein
MNAAHGNQRSRQTSINAMAILVGIGPPGVPALLSLMTNQNPQVRTCAIMVTMGSTDPRIVSQIKKSVQDPHPQVRDMATNALNHAEERTQAHVGKP